MEKLEDKELLKVEGGAINWAWLAGIGAAASFIIGVIDGWTNPKKCNN